MRRSRQIALVLTLAALAACASEAADDGVESSAADAITDGFETIPANEAQLNEQISQAAQSQVRKALETATDGIARRDAHPKAHGCVRGRFTVEDELPDHLARGTFVPGAEYDAWVRYSNGSQQDDRTDDARGMAIKLIGVEGEKLLPGAEATAVTHDFVLTNYHTFFIETAKQYVDFMQTVAEQGNPLSFFFSLRNLQFHPIAAIRAKRFTSQPISDPLTSRYWSVTPYLLGDDQAVKYSAIPCDGVDDSGDHADDENYMHNALKSHLTDGDGCFDFMVQVRNGNQSIENPTQTWDEDDAPFEKVARLVIDAQEFDSPEQTSYCENLSFTPWHATKTHRPLGTTNRTRKVVYAAVQKLRHDLNGSERVEPTDLSLPE